MINNNDCKKMRMLLDICKDMQSMDKNGDFIGAYEEVCNNESTLDEVVEQITQIVSNWMQELDKNEDKAEYRVCLSIFKKCSLIHSNNIKGMSNEQVLDRIVKDGVFSIQWFDKNPSLARRICQRWNECVNNHGDQSEIDILKEKIDIIDVALSQKVIQL